MNSIVLKQYSAGFLTLLITVVTSFQMLNADGLTETELWQLGSIGVSTLGVIFLPILKSGPAGGLKIGVAVLGAIFAALMPLTPLSGGWSADSIILVGLAALNALAGATGVAVRLDSVKEQIVNPAVSNAEVFVLDKTAYTSVVTKNPGIEAISPGPAAASSIAVEDHGGLAD